MSPFFDEYDLLELFGDEPNILDEEAKIFQYHTKDEYGFSLYLLISAFEEFLVLRLEHDKLVNPIFDIEIKNIHKINCDHEKIEFYYRIDSSKDKIAKLYLKPSFELEVDLS